MSLAEATQSIKSKVGDSSPISSVVKFDFSDDGVIRIDGTQTPPVVDNENGPADCTISVSLSDFEEMLAGNQNPQMAFMSGKLSVDGDMSIAMQLGSLLG